MGQKGFRGCVCVSARTRTKVLKVGQGSKNNMGVFRWLYSSVHPWCCPLSPRGPWISFHLSTSLNLAPRGERHSTAQHRTTSGKHLPGIWFDYIMSQRANNDRSCWIQICIKNVSRCSWDGFLFTHAIRVHFVCFPDGISFNLNYELALIKAPHIINNKKIMISIHFILWSLLHNIKIAIHCTQECISVTELEMCPRLYLDLT